MFVIIVLALLSAAMARMVETGARTHALEILSAKAFHAAESGGQLGVNAVMAPNGVGACANVVFSFQDAALASCSANVTCASTTIGTDVFYTITSVGICDAVDLTTQRTVQVGLKL